VICRIPGRASGGYDGDISRLSALFLAAELSSDSIGWADALTRGAFYSFVGFGCLGQFLEIWGWWGSELRN
jgi:hypothetical protein